MEGNKAYIVVAQTDQDFLEQIRGEDKGINHVVYSNDPAYVLRLALQEPVDVVITGSVFSERRLTVKELLEQAGLLEQEKASGLLSVTQIGELQRAREKKWGDLERVVRGSNLSEAIYARKPEVLVFRYSTTPYDRGRIVGDIPKFKKGDCLIELINSGELPAVLTRKDWARLRALFPAIHFYDEFEKEHR